MLTFHSIGRWPVGHVHSRWLDDSSWRSSPDIDALIDAAWRSAAARPGVHLFDGPMCRVESWHATDASLELAFSPTSYRLFLGTNLAHPELAGQFGPASLANPMGVSPAIVTADNHLLLGRRNAAVAYYPNRVHPFSGALEPRDAVDVLGAVRRELREELSIADGDVTDLACVGIAEDRAIRQPELICAARLRLDRATLERQIDPAEHVGLWSAPAEAPSVEAALAERDTLLTPIACAALLLWGRIEFGQAWFETRCATMGLAPTAVLGGGPTSR